MEVGRRSFSSQYEFLERRLGGKKKIPLAMILSFNDKGVHPDCPDVSNPYHKCGRHCLDKIPIGREFLDAIRSGGDQEWEKKSEKKGVNPNCPYASNPYHKCAEYCLEKSSAKRQDSGKDQSEKSKEDPKKSKKDKVHLNRNASNLNEVTKYVFEDTPKKEHLKGGTKSKKENEIDLTTQHELSSLCKNASKPYHVCDEYCFQSVAERERHEQVIKLERSKDGEKVMNNIKSTVAKPKEESEIIETVTQIVNPEYKNASNPSDVCPEYCFESVPEREQHEQIIRLKSTKEGDKFLNNRHRAGFNTRCKHASKPHHECTQFCFKSTPDRSLAEEEKTKGVSLKIEKSSPLPDNKHIWNPYHEVIDDCFNDNPEQEHPDGEERMVVTADPGVDLLCKYASNPNHECTEYCFQNLPNEDQHGKALTKSKENEAVIPLEGVNPQCKHASNPYHVCAEYCSQNVSNGRHPGRSIKESKEEDTKVLSSERQVNPECKFASNPYHVCAEYCFQNALKREQQGQAFRNLKEEDTAILLSAKRVSPECKFATNPYHVCAEYCIQNSLERKQQGQILKLKSLKELKNLVSNKTIASGNPHCEYSSNPYHQCAEYCFNKNVPGGKISDGVMKTNERKKENSHALKRDDNPKYKNASNSFKCSEYCPEETSSKSEAVEGSTATIKKKKRNSSKTNKRNHPLVEKKTSLNSNYMEASKPGQNYVESSERLILQDGTEKNSMESKYAQTFNPTNNTSNLNSGISMYMQYEAKDLQSAKMEDIKNPNEPSDVLPLHNDASDLFHEWAKYSSQTKSADDKIVKQGNKVGIGELTTRNGKGNGLLKDNDSPNMEKRSTRNLKG